MIIFKTRYHSQKNTGNDVEYSNLPLATFAGGCFWCMEPAFESEDGVYNVVVGYSGGDVENPTYEQVTSGNTGHVEAVQMRYDPEIISYEKLVEIYFKQTDPTDELGQFADKGPSYKPVIFYHNENQKKGSRAIQTKT